MTCALALAACSAQPAARDVAPEDTSSDLPPIDPSLAEARIGSRLRASRDAAIRGEPAPEGVVRDLVPRDGVAVVVKTSRPTNGYFLVYYAGISGWAHGSLFTLAPIDYSPPLPSNASGEVIIPEGADATPDVPAPSGPTGPSSETPSTETPPSDTSQPPPTNSDPRAQAIARAQSGVGFSYYWGGGAWDPAGANDANAGVCSGGSCPDCTHSGRYGADCSGFAAKVWQVPDSNTVLTTHSHPFSTVTFTHSSNALWTTVDRGQALMGDAFTYNVDGKGHIFVFASGDGWGHMYTYESRSCSVGIVYNLRTADSRYKVIRRQGW